ncbi:MAG: AarF/ABC1/UbiB kinase family protein [Alphaproteobacteria bacterium]|nr:AarF/ABC1/UbiB kinase family protein [Alphaproteobacteria bacterium]
MPEGPKRPRGEEDSLGRRMRRYAQVSASVGTLAARLGAERFLGVTIDREQHAAELRRALGGIKGPLMKVAQMLSTIPDALPEQYVDQLAQLQSHAPAMGWLFVRRRMTAELGPDWELRFAAFAREAAAAASLGQVHRAEGLDGRAFACKLQYPNMRSAVEADLRQLKFVFALFHRIDRAVDPVNIHAEISERLREEIDYRREGRHMRLYTHMLRREKGVSVPDYVPELSTDRLLTMTWLEGRSMVAAIETASQRQRNHLAQSMFRAWYVPFYFYGVIHGDPHLGNYTVRDDWGINLLDFGCIRVFKPSFVQGVIDLYHALERHDPALAVHAYESWGFTGLSKDVIDTLNLWAAFVYTPLLEDRARRIQEVGSGHYGQEVAAKVHRELHRLGGVRPPREFVLMDRAAIGLGSVFLRLKAEINWHRQFQDLIQGFSVPELAARQSAALGSCELPLP